MGERKVLNKYYPADFDPAKIPRPKNQQTKSRMMIPMSVRCGTCCNYMYMGSKFNSRKEDAVGEKYLGIQVFRFYIKCTKCSAEITFKTDPRNSDYVVESGASRNFEPWRAGEVKKKTSAEEMGDAMKSLENRSLESKREMDILAALDELKSIKSRHATVSVDVMLEALRSKEQKERMLEDQDQAALINSMFKRQREQRIIDDDFDFVFEGTSTLPPKRRKVSEESNNRDHAGVGGVSDDVKFIFKSSSVRISTVKKSGADSTRNKPKEGTDLQFTTTEAEKEKEDPQVPGLQSLFQSYGCDDDE